MAEWISEKMKPILNVLIILLVLITAWDIPSEVSASLAPDVLITAVYFDPSVTGEASEAIQVQNMRGADCDWELGCERW